MLINSFSFITFSLLKVGSFNTLKRVLVLGSFSLSLLIPTLAIVNGGFIAAKPNDKIIREGNLERSS